MTWTKHKKCFNRKKHNIFCFFIYDKNFTSIPTVGIKEKLNKYSLEIKAWEQDSNPSSLQYNTVVIY